MKKEKKPKHFISKPVFEGGIKAMRQLITANLEYPEEALKKKIEGTVKLRYEVNYLGVVTKTSIIHHLGYGCDEEAQRLVRLFRFKVRKNRKVKVVYHKTIQIHFRLPKDPVLKTPHVSYSYITPGKQAPQTPSKKTYTYTVHISKP